MFWFNRKKFVGSSGRTTSEDIAPVEVLAAFIRHHYSSGPWCDQEQKMDLCVGSGRPNTCPMKSYRQFCPMARASELVAERWTPIILRNLLAGCTTFSEILDGSPGLSKTLLTQRLRRLERHQIVERRPGRSSRSHTYHLTPIGYDLAPILEELAVWGQRYLDLGPEHLNPYLVLWEMSRLIPESELPEQRVVTRFELTDLTRRNCFWLVLEPNHSEVCDKHPGWDEDLVFRTDSRTLAEWHLGWIEVGQAMREGRIELTGPRSVVREFTSRWQGLSHQAEVEAMRLLQLSDSP